MMRLRATATAVFLMVAATAHGGGLDDYYLARFNAVYGGGALKATTAAATAGRDRGCLTPLYHDLKRDWKQLSSGTQATLAKYLQRPTLPAERVVKSGGGHFAVHYATTGADAPPLDDGNGNSIPDWVETVADVFEAVYDREVTQLGFRPPPTNGGTPYDVYLQNTAPQNEFGSTMSDLFVNPVASTSYIVLDNDFVETIFHPYQGVLGLKVTAAHEFHHAIQYGYNFYFDIWYGEATATWMEDEVYDSINQLYSYLPPYFLNPELPVNIPPDTATGGGYGRWIFNRYLSETFSSGSMVRSVWELLGTKAAPPDGSDIPMLPVLDEALAGRGSSIHDVFLGFARRFFTRTWTSHVTDTGMIPSLSIKPENILDGMAAVSIGGPTPPLPIYSFTYYQIVKRSDSPLTLSFPSQYAAIAFHTSGTNQFTEYLPGAAGVISIPLVANGDSVYLLLCNNDAAGSVSYPAEPTVVTPNPADAVNPNPGTVTFYTPPPSSSSTDGGGGGCFIATAAYGSYLHPKVRVLREFRDRHLLTNPVGRAFVSAYYRYSPPVAAFISRHGAARSVCRGLLVPVVLTVEHPEWGGVLLLVAGGAVVVRLQRKKENEPVS